MSRLSRIAPARCLPFLALAVVAVVAGCTEIPELDATLSPQLEQADYPALIPLDDSLFEHPEPRDEARELQQGLDARSRRLHDRARALQGPVVDDATRDRMAEGVTPPVSG
ncbi:hypothetical protein [Pukyongiella litopenaei]|uniref:hypothetical protein n=1 Tax=Pukyongiella litopenaei TaxID=2605946 RepID=UPI001B809DF8|nr:hypothetical protein [Pukyongiella litopenaei]